MLVLGEVASGLHPVEVAETRLVTFWLSPVMAAGGIRVESVFWVSSTYRGCWCHLMMSSSPSGQRLQDLDPVHSVYFILGALSLSSLLAMLL